MTPSICYEQGRPTFRSSAGKKYRVDTWLSAYVQDSGAVIGNGNQRTGTITVTGASPGDLVIVTASKGLQRLIMTGSVDSANTVTWVLNNHTGGPITLGAVTFKAFVGKF